jgi:molybdate transport system substrate-binding protein
MTKQSRRLFVQSLVAVIPFPVLTASVSLANAAQLKLLSARAMEAALGDIVVGYEKASGNKVAVELGTVGAITERLQKGEAADVAIVSDQQIIVLQKQGKIAAGSSVAMARVGYGMFVKKGAPRPDISTVDALKQTLLAAKSIAYSDPKEGGPVGIYMAGLVEHLGLAAELKPKTRLTKPGETFKLLTSGEIELIFHVTSDISLPEAADADLAGLLPEPVQRYTLFSAGVVSASREPDNAKALIATLTSANAKAALKAKGFEPRR